MASTRKKQDEKNLKTLRELVSLPQNKHCFDCHQRGPTYVNVTIGCFVCTKCSGMLRGLTPPHRVKSISMATFTAEEMELLQNRGNDYCRRTWLGLYEGPTLSEGRDEQQIRDFMTDKYERRRFYLEPSSSAVNGVLPSTKQLHHLVPETKILRLNGDRKNDEVKSLLRTNAKGNATTTASTTNFVANFESADIFNAVNNNWTNQASFANFVDNPVFGSTNMPTSNDFSSNVIQQKNNANIPPAPPEDRYAALKDLDNAFKNQPTLDWNSSSAGGSLYSSPTPAGSLYSSSSPQSIYGSPSQGQFASIFATGTDSAALSNPFNSRTNLSWTNGASQNPFRLSGAFTTNGFGQDMQQQTLAQQANGLIWTANPFKIGSLEGRSNNPFL